MKRAAGVMAVLLVAGLAVWLGWGERRSDDGREARGPGPALAPPEVGPSGEVAIRTVPAPRAEAPPSPPPASSKGTLTLAFTTRDGRKVAGVQATVAAPDGPIAEVRDSGEDGTISWSLAPGRYRWRKQSRHVVEISPGHEGGERFRAVMRDGGATGWLVEGRPVEQDGISGLIEVKEDEVVRIEILVKTAARIVGSLPAGILVDDRPWCAVHLYRTERHASPAGPESDLVREVHLRSAGAGPDGRFGFDDVDAGSYVLQAWWRIGDEYAFTRMALSELQEGETRDAGLLAPVPAHSVPFVIRVVEDGRALAPSDLFGELPEPLRARMLLLCADPAVPAGLDLDVMVDVEVGRTVHLLGLVPGTWQVRALVDPAWPAGMGPLVPPDAAARFVVPAAATVTYDYRLAAPAAHGSVLDLEVRSAASTWINYWIVGASGRVRSGAAPPEAWKQGIFRERIPIADPEVTVVVSTHGVPAPAEAANLWGLCKAAVAASEARALIDLAPGARHRGRAVRKDQSPFGQETLSLRPAGLPGKSALFLVTTDEGGWFELQGMPPGSELEVLWSRQRIPRDPVITIDR